MDLPFRLLTGLTQSGEKPFRLTFPSLLCHTVHICRYLYPVGRPSSLDGLSLGHWSFHHSYRGSAVPNLPSSLTSEEEAISGWLFSLNVAACTLARAAGQ